MKSAGFTLKLIPKKISLFSIFLKSSIFGQSPKMYVNPPQFHSLPNI